MGLDLDFDKGRLFGAVKRHERVATDRAMFLRFTHVMHCHHHRQGGAITAAMPCTAGLLPTLAETGRLGLPSTVRTGRFFAFGAVQPLGQVTDGGLERFHVRLQGHFGFPIVLAKFWGLRNVACRLPQRS